jgi:hypothetical protein
VPAIVVDTNNDLARLGDAWPEMPAVWDEADRQRHPTGLQLSAYSPAASASLNIRRAAGASNYLTF